MKEMPLPQWKKYELFVARLMREENETGLCVTPNAWITGAISKRKRQIDVVIDLRHDTDNSRRIIVDAKARKRKVDVTHVEAFKGLMEDVEAVHGYLVCPAGFSPAAKLRAEKSVTIRLISLDELEYFDPSTWEKCQRSGCRTGRVFWDGYPELSIGGINISNPSETITLLRSVHMVGKCDRCGRFHVNCLRCKELFSMNDESEHKCQCNPPWFWLTSIESDECGRKSAELHCVSVITGQPTTFTRRPL